MTEKKAERDTMPTTVIHNPSCINIKRDALIEASAGTGKTYTLTRLVVRLILEEKMDLESILVVTYTEKAAGEMKERLRQLLEEAADTGTFLDKPLEQEERERLRRQSLNYDSAPIQTIHSFCLGTLQRYAFENGYHFQLEQIDDGELAQTAFRDILQNGLFPKYKENIEELIRISGFSKTNSFGKSWEEQVIGLAVSTHPEYTRLLPMPEKKLLETVSRALKDFQRLIKKSLSFSEKLYSNPRKFVEAAAAQDKNLLSLFPAPIKFEFMKNKGQTPEQEKTLTSLIDTIKEINASGKQFLSEAVILTKERLRILKEEQHQISFNDMLTRVEEGLRREGDLLVQALRGQYRAALVDEFQDTDPIQWSIFRTVFLESEDHRLFIIGDPKQAIYSFRGANIHTYYQATEALGALGSSRAGCYRLPTNWRSDPKAIAAGNTFFREYFTIPEKTEAWQRFTSFHVVQAPGSPQNRLKNGKDVCGLFGCEIEEDLNATPARQESASRIAADILRTLNSSIEISRDSGKSYRRICPRDICVLTRKKTMRKLVEKALLRLNIPCSIYKKEGIYNSKEALHISLVLRYLAAPEDNDLCRLALLTLFFEHEQGTIPSVPAPGSKAETFLKRLRELAAHRNWGEFFRTLLIENGAALRLYPEAEGPRSLTNIEHISQNLEAAAVTGGFDIHRLSEHLQRLINNQEDGGQDEDLHRVESEEPSVQIMTIHASKGLEFPFVYVTSPLEDHTPSPKCYIFTDDDDKRVYDLTKSPENKPRYEHEENEEKKRILYVALTRGIFRTTLFFQNSDKKLHFSNLARSLPAACGAATTEMIPWTPATDNNQEALPDPLFAIAKEFEKTGYKKRRISLASFSSLIDHVEGAVSFGEPEQPADEAEAPAIPEMEGSIILPRGPRTGNLLHALLEKTDFSSAAKGKDAFLNENRERIRKALKSSRIRPVLSGFEEALRKNRAAMDKGLISHIGEILYNALTTPLQAKDGSAFTLSEIPENERVHELEFHFKMEEAEAKRLPEHNGWFAEGFLTGFIDLIFRHNGVYYILDWKSNWLPGYEQHHLTAGMKAHNYNLQAEIYSEALRRWLDKHDHDASGNSFGGVFYLFLRGLGNRDEGVFTIREPKPFPMTKEATRG